MPEDIADIAATDSIPVLGRHCGECVRLVVHLWTRLAHGSFSHWFSARVWKFQLETYLEQFDLPFLGGRCTVSQNRTMLVCL